jgi:hypothetical protein
MGPLRTIRHVYRTPIQSPAALAPSRASRFYRCGGRIVTQQKCAKLAGRILLRSARILLRLIFQSKT